MSFSEDNLDFHVGDIYFVVDRAPNPNWSVNYAHDRYHIAVFATGGTAHYKVEGRQYRIKKGDLLFFPKHLHHEGISDSLDPWSFISVLFDIRFANEGSEQKIQRLRHIMSATNPFELSALFNELYRTWSLKKLGYLIKCRGILMQILYLYIREDNLSTANVPYYYTIEKLMNMIASDYQTIYTSTQLAQYAGISPSYLRILFKKVTGLTVNQYQNHIKISKARDLLLSGECNVTEASQRTGFSDIFYFSKLFKKMTGLNPSDYINK